MKYVSLFAGIGGFDLALQRLGHECVYANDFDKYCKIVYDKNFSRGIDVSKERIGKEDASRKYEEGKGLHAISGEGAIYQDGWIDEHLNGGSNKRQFVGLDCRSITKVPTSNIPDHDLLVGGFPCQSFSIAGKRGGFNDTRGTMFFEIARILEAKRPTYLLLENVKGLLSHDNGRTFETIMRTLTELGYDLQWQVLNSKNFGVPQNRERVYIVGHLRGTSRPKIFPFEHSDQKDFREEGETSKEGERIRGQNISAAIDANYWKGPGSTRQMIQVVGMLDDEKWRRFNESSRRVYGTQGISPTIPTAAGGGHTPKIESNMRIRKLTPIECERLQGFPDNWTEGVSDTQRYKMCGNAVTVNVVYEIARRLGNI